MAYNNLSGTVYLPDNLITRVDVLTNSIVSGNLSYSDGADIINVPRVATPNANSLVINNNGNANNLRCDTELTFDGTTLSIVGNLTASINISASSFYGDGSNLTGISAGGTSGGIFTEINATQAYTTSSIQIGADTTPSSILSVAGTSHLSGGIIHNRTTASVDYSITATDYYLGVNTASNSVKLTLPPASTISIGQTFVIKDEIGTAETNNITISGSASDKIDGENMLVLESPYAAISLYCDGVDNYLLY
jgi:hypothetical protein